MTWKPISQEDIDLCIQMRTWIEVARKWFNEPTWLPTDPDIYKSALLERLRNGLEPLEYPPPLGFSCPWYALIDDPIPHRIGAGSNIEHPNKPPKDDQQRWNDVYFGPWDIAPDKTSDMVQIFQTGFVIVERLSLEDYILKDGRHDTPYRFRLFFDKEYRLSGGQWTNPETGEVKPARLAYQHGAWFLQYKTD